MISFGKFMKTLVSDPKAKELLKGLKEPANVEEAAERYASIAHQIGMDVKKEDIASCLKKAEEAKQSVAAKAEEAVKKALGDSDLDAVAGGAATNCADTFAPGEWCFFTDSCSVVINYYDDPMIAPHDEQCAKDAYYIDTNNTFEDSFGTWEGWEIKSNCTKNFETSDD